MPISLDHTLPLFHSLGRQRCHDLCRFLLHLGSRSDGRYVSPCAFVQNVLVTPALGDVRIGERFIARCQFVVNLGVCFLSFCTLLITSSRVVPPFP
jgi:hypothetical protein